MKNESERIHVRLDTKRWGSRTAKVEEIVDSFRFSLPHPHDFSPPAADICWIPEVQKAIIDGTDEEFQVCEANIRSTIPELSVTWLEERRKFFLQLLPQDSPTLEQLSLAATLFDCTKCYVHGMRIEETLSHRCHRRWDEYKPFKERFSSVNSANVFHNDVGTPWNPEFSEYRYSAKLSALIREVILECGENPDTITAKEMNRKHYRFACFGKDGAVTVLSWSQAVGSRVYSLENLIPNLHYTFSSSTSANMEAHHVGSSGLTNYRNMYLNRGLTVPGVVSGAGEQGNLNGTVGTSLSSKFTLLIRKCMWYLDSTY